jgi:dienelactone hydrolase
MKAVILAFIAACGMTASGQQGVTTPVPSVGIQAFAAPPLIDRPKLSPDGLLYAGELSGKGQSMLAVVHVNAADGKSVAVGIGEKNELNDWLWVNDDWLIITVSTTVKYEGEDVRVRRAYGVSARDGKIVPIARESGGQDGANLLWVARDGTPRVLIGIQQSLFTNMDGFYPAVFEVDVSTGRMTMKAKSEKDVMDWYADGEGNVRIGIAYNDLRRTYRMIYREKNGEIFHTIDRANAREGENLTVPALFLADKGKALAYDDSSGFDALYELDLKTMNLGRQVYSIEGYDIGSLHSDATQTQLVGVSYTDTRTHTEWLEPIMARNQRELDGVAGSGARARIVSSDRDGSKFIVHMGAADTPGAYHLFDLNKRLITRLAPVNPELLDSKIAPVSTFRYKTRDGLEVEAILTLPPGRAAKNLPLIVLPHGGPAARDEADWDWWSEYLAYIGYAVVKPNYRGSTGYGTEFQDKGYGQWGLAMQDDLIDAIDHLASAGTVDPKRVCIAGASYGGYAALRAAQRDGARYRCAISYAGVADIADLMRYDSGFLNSGRTRDYRKRSAPDYKGVSPSNFPEQFSIPVLLMHGKRDLTVPVRQSRAMAEKLKKAGKRMRYVEQPLGDHHFSRTEDRLEFLKEMTDFLQANNPAG